MSDYRTFLRGKRRSIQPVGFDTDAQTVNSKLFDWQRDIVRWAVKRGRAALLEDCGLGKTPQQLAFAELCVKRHGGMAIIHCPVGVRQQTKREAEKFGIDVPVVVANDQSECRPNTIHLVNYEKLHHFKPESFACVVLDESSILKSFTGTTKRALCEAYRESRFRLACTATPAPNDFMELGNHADFLGVMPSNEMLSRWFINDTMKAGGYRLKRHAESDFWEWVASWAVCIEKPSDLGYSNDGFILPPLGEIEHLVEPNLPPPPGLLFDVGGALSATTMHSTKRKTVECRASEAARIVATDTRNAWIVWCDTNYEADELVRAIPEALEVRGCDPEESKEEKLAAFSSGAARILITKPTVAGFGMNWQHCHNVVFVGLSYSYEQYYQAVRRTWRFGQTHPVNVHLVSTPQEAAMREAIQSKQSAHSHMKEGMAAAMKAASLEQVRGELKRTEYQPDAAMRLPEWMKRSA